MRLLIIEDEKAAADRLKHLLGEIPGAFTILGPLQGIADVLDWFEKNEAPDLILMDIELSDGNSFEILRRINIPSAIIFTTSYDAFALQAFSFNSIDYLLKPVSRAALEKSLAKYDHLRNDLSRSANFRRHFLVRQGQAVMPVDIGHIAYFTAEARLCFLTTTGNGRYAIDHTIAELETMLDPELFFRANRGCLVHFPAIVKAKKTLTGKLLLETIPSSRKEIVVSKERVREFRDWLNERKG